MKRKTIVQAVCSQPFQKCLFEQINDPMQSKFSKVFGKTTKLKMFY